MNLDRLRDACKVRGLVPDDDPPTQVSPGVFMFYATILTHECRSKGDCRHQRYYAILLGDSIVIQHTF